MIYTTIFPPPRIKARNASSPAPKTGRVLNDLWKCRARSVLKVLSFGIYGRVRVVGFNTFGKNVYQRINWYGQRVSWHEHE